MGIKDNKEAVKWYAKSAEQGYTKAEFVLSLCYSEGKGVLRNKKEAGDWIAKVLAHANADELCAFSQYRLNNPMEDCSDWSNDLSEEEFKCLKKSAELDNVVAQAQLGNFYSSGRYVNRDQIEAVKWWTKAAEQGDALAKKALIPYHNTDKP
jgi:TPR repeat protein